MKQPLYKIGDELVVEDNDLTVKVLEIAQYAQKIPTGMGKRYYTRKGWEYRVAVTKAKGAKVARASKAKKDYWVDEHLIVGKVTFQPGCFTPARHMELGDELPGYQIMREWLETVPDKTSYQGMMVVRNLKDLLENLALYHAGTRSEQADAGEEIGFALR